MHVRRWFSNKINLHDLTLSRIERHLVVNGPLMQCINAFLDLTRLAKAPAFAQSQVVNIFPHVDVRFPVILLGTIDDTQKYYWGQDHTLWNPSQ